MGRKSRHRPAKLAEKLFAIRTKLGLSQKQLIEKLECKEVSLYKGDISNYELGKSEPPLVVLLHYARIGRVTIDYLANDEVETIS